MLPEAAGVSSGAEGKVNVNVPGIMDGGTIIFKCYLEIHVALFFIRMSACTLGTSLNMKWGGSDIENQLAFRANFLLALSFIQKTVLFVVLTIFNETSPMSNY